jgi:hypothetical protein
MKNILRVKNNISHWFLALLIAALSWNSARAQDYSNFFSNNGSFEFGTSSPPLLFPDENSSLSTITGWRVSALGEFPMWLEDLNAQNGSRYLRLNASGGSTAGSSRASIRGYDFSHTPFTIGDMYELSFWAAGSANGDNNLRVTLTTTSLQIQEEFNVHTFTDINTGLNWNRYTVPFTATDYTMILGFLATDSSHPEQNGSVYLDNVSIIAVPEPTGAVLMLAAGLTLGIRRRRPILAMAC